MVLIITDSNKKTGYKKPPQNTRFPKGRSGNPKGRPRGSVNEPPYEWILGEKVAISMNGEEKTVTRVEAFLLKLLKGAIGGKLSNSISLSHALESVRNRREEAESYQVAEITIVPLAIGSLGESPELLRIAKKMNRFSEDTYYKLEPRIIEEALRRLGKKELSIEDQRKVRDVTRFPDKVKWPDWWEALP